MRSALHSASTAAVGMTAPGKVCHNRTRSSLLQITQKVRSPCRPPTGCKGHTAS
jgi:hypothetical protein